MRRYGNLFEQVISLDNLRLADEKARKGKRHSLAVQQHDEQREAHILALHEALVNKTFHTSVYERFKVYTPKEREIYRLPYYPDRILHHAIMNVCEPIWNKTFTYNTYCCIRRRGIHGCAARVKKMIRSFKGKTLYCLKIDLTKFYPSIDHDILKSIIRKKIKDRDLLWLLDEIIDSTAGLPIGNYLSQPLANLYLAYFMHWVNETLAIPCCEYADDIIFFAEHKAVLHAALARVRDYLDQVLCLTIKSNYQIFPVAASRCDCHGRAIDYVGYCFYREHTALRKSIKKNFCRAVARLNRRHTTLKTYRMALSAWMGWAKYSNSKQLLHKIIRIDYYEKLCNTTAACA